MKKQIVCTVLLFLAHALNCQTDPTLRLNDTVPQSFTIPIFNTGGDDGESTMDQQDLSPLLQSSRDVFTQFASFQFGAARYKMRGLSAENQHIYFNGVILNDPATGYAGWSNWGGLNDVTRFAEVRIGSTPNRYGFSGPGGYINLDSKASSFKKATKFSYAATNRVFRNRVMLSHSTGELKNGCSFTFAGSVRSGNEVYFPGSYFNAGALYISADKKFSDQHSLTLTCFVSPIEQGRKSAITKELFDLNGDAQYNSKWGYQNGRVRNANVSKSVKPTIVLNDKLVLKNDAVLQTSLYYSFGKTGTTALNWHHAENPYPDYYRYLPSYYYSLGQNVAGDRLKERWLNDVQVQQINWDKLTQMNRANLYTDPHLLGQVVNTTETRARYILERRIENIKNLGFVSVYNKKFKRIFFTAGVNANLYRNRRYKEIEDLLGASFWIDVDQFAQNLGIEDYIQQNDLDNPNKKIKTDDRFGYDYSINVNRAELWSQAEYGTKNYEVYVGLTGTGIEGWREGFVANGKFPNSSKGESAHLKFLCLGLKAGFIYKINGRQFITLNSMTGERAPDLGNVFLSPNVRNDIISNPQNEKYFSGDLNYHLQYPTFKLRITYYNTQIKRQTWLRTYWHEEFNNTVNLIMKNIDHNHQGIELGAEKILFTSHTLQCALGYGKFTYTNRPTLEAWQDNNNQSLYEQRTTFLRNYYIGGTPQLVVGAGYKYTGRKYWFSGVSANYFDEMYIEPNPDRRTSEATSKYQENEKIYAAQITTQEKLPAFFMLNANAGKSFRIGGKYFMNVQLSLNNLLNNKTIVVGGFESLRWEPTDVKKFATKYNYMNGITYMLNLTCSL